MSWAVPTYSRISSSSGVNLPQSSPRNAVEPRPSSWKMRTLPNCSGALPRLLCFVVLQHVVHRHAQLVLGPVEVAELGGMHGVGLLDGHVLELLHQHLLGFVDADRLEEPRAESGPEPGRSELLVGEVLQPHVLPQRQRPLVVGGHGPIVEALGQVAQQVADPHAGRSGSAGGDLPDQGRFVGRVADRQDLDVQRLAADAFALSSSRCGTTRKMIVFGSICVLAQEKSTWLTPLTSGTIRSSSTSVALGLSNWISTRCRTGSVISLIRACASVGTTNDAAIAKVNINNTLCLITELLDVGTTACRDP